MRLIAQQVLLLLLSSTIPLVTSAQTPSTNVSKTPGTVTGRVTVGSQPAQGVEVMIRPIPSTPIMDVLQFAPAVTTTTDAEGRYRLTSLAPGNYRLSVYAPAYVTDRQTDPYFSGITVNVREGETVENLDVSLTLGGVLTGKVTDPDDRPVIGERISVSKLQADGKTASPGLNDIISIFQTDDRGIYRIFGLEPGRYLIAAGSAEVGMVRTGPSDTYYRKTFYPSAVDEKEAKPLAIKSGDVLENINIKLARASAGKTFSAKGRVIEVETGNAVPGVIIGYTSSRQGTASGVSNSATNSLGEFVIDGLTPNTYRLYSISLLANENYGEQVQFEISDSNVEGLELKMLRGMSISGVAVIEGSDDPRLREKLTKVQLLALPAEDSRSDSSFSLPKTASISESGAFRIPGVPPGIVRLAANTMMVQGISLVRIEHNGAEVNELQVNARQQVTGVRLVFVAANGSISGRVEVRDGTLPPNVQLSVMATRQGTKVPDFGIGMVNVDPRGQFLIENLTPGTYKLVVYPRGTTAGVPDFPRTEQTVVVADHTRYEVTVVVDLRKR